MAAELVFKGCYELSLHLNKQMHFCVYYCEASKLWSKYTTPKVNILTLVGSGMV